MSNELITNGYFKKGFSGWGPSDFDPKLELHDTGNSVLLPVDAFISQQLPDLSGQTLVLRFEAKALEDADFPYVTVSVGGLNAEGYMQVSPVMVALTREWQAFVARLFFSKPLTQCFLNVATPRPAVQGDTAEGSEVQASLTPARIGKLSLTAHTGGQA